MKNEIREQYNAFFKKFRFYGYLSELTTFLCPNKGKSVEVEVDDKALIPEILAYCRDNGLRYLESDINPRKLLVFFKKQD